MEANIRLPWSYLRWTWDWLRTSFWFLPSVMAACAVLAAYLFVEIDASLSERAIREFGWLYAFGPEGARAILSAIAGSMITVAGLTFSITMLTLQLASSQFGPRLLRHVMRDRGNQIVLGTFVSTFVYCLLVMRTVRGVEGASNVPHLSVAVGVMLALASLGVLIYFIHHIATKIRIETILAELVRDANAAIDFLYPERIGSEPQAHGRPEGSVGLPQDFQARAAEVPAPRSGYVQHIDADALMTLAGELDLVLRIDAPPGKFLCAGESTLTAYPGERITDAVRRSLRAAVNLGLDRSSDQDVAHALRLIVEIAQRALSPGVNDPTTALYCLDRLEESLTRLAGRESPSGLRLDRTGTLRVVTEVPRFEDLACNTLAAVARYGSRDADVAERLLRTIAKLTRTAQGTASTRLTALAVALEKRAGDDGTTGP